MLYGQDRHLAWTKFKWQRQKNRHQTKLNASPVAYWLVLSRYQHPKNTGQHSTCGAYLANPVLPVPPTVAKPAKAAHSIMPQHLLTMHRPFH